MSNQFESISSDQLSDVSGGLSWKSALKFTAKRVAGPLSAAYGGYQGGNAYFDARDHGKSVKDSLWAGVKKGVRAAAF